MNKLTNPISLIGLLFAINLFYIPQINGLKTEQLKVNLKTHNETCHICEEIVDVIIYEVKEANKTIDDLTHLIEDLCQIIGGGLVHKECEEILGTIREIVSWITHGLNSTMICDKLHFCNSTNIIHNQYPIKSKIRSHPHH